MDWKSLILGRVDFGEDEEYLKFKYRFLMLVMLASLLICIPFILADWFGTNSIGRHLYSVQTYVVVSCALIAILRHHKDLFVQITWLYVFASLFVHLSAFIFVPADELREVWRYSLIVCVYILLGQKAGAAIAAMSIGTLLVANQYTSAPVSERGMGTWIASIVSLSIIFHAYTSRSLSYYKRMHASNKELRHISQHDALTGVLNRRAMIEVTDRLMCQAVAPLVLLLQQSPPWTSPSA